MTLMPLTTFKFLRHFPVWQDSIEKQDTGLKDVSNGLFYMPEAKGRNQKEVNGSHTDGSSIASVGIIGNGFYFQPSQDKTGV